MIYITLVFEDALSEAVMTRLLNHFHDKFLFIIVIQGMDLVI